MSNASLRKCLHCNTAATSTHRLKNCGRCKMVAYCNTSCQHADWPTHKHVCNRDDGLRLGYASGADGSSIVFQDPSGRTVDEVYNSSACIMLRMPPSAETPHEMRVCLKLEPAVAKEFATLTAGEKAFIEHTATEAMWNQVHEDTIRQTIVEAIGMAKKAKRALEKREEVQQEGEGESEDEDDEDDESEDYEVGEGFWEKVRKVLVIKY